MKFLFPVFLFFFLSGQAQELEFNAPVQAEWEDSDILKDYFQSFKVVKVDRQSLLARWPASDVAAWSMNVPEFPVLLLSLHADKNLISALELNRTVKLLSGRSQEGRLVSGLLTDYTFQITIDLNNEKWVIEPLKRFIRSAPDDLYVSYYTSDFIDAEERTCAAKDAGIKGKEIEQSLNKSLNQCNITQIAIANDFSMFERYGSVAEVEDHNIGVMNDVQANYRHEFDDNIEFIITTQFVPTSAANDPFTSSTNASTLLSNFRTWGNNGGFNGAVYDVASLWTTRDLDGSTVGIAYVGVICTGSRYNVLSDYTSSTESKRVLTAHEIGHNFNARHDGSGTNFIMAPSVTLTDNWSSTSINSISSHVDSRSCLASCSTEGSPASDFVTKSGSASCAPATIQFKDFSEYGATRTWTLPGSTTGSSTAQQPDVTYNSVGDYDVTVQSNNGAGTNSRTFVDAISVLSEPSTPCSPSGSPSDGGITRFTLSNVTNNSSGSSAAGRLEDFRCENTIELEPNTTYNITVGLGNCGGSQVFERFQLYIDYNNDGSFSGSERVSQTNSFWCGTVGSSNDSGLQFTTPNSIAEDVLYLIRAVVDNSTPGSCPSLSTGQVEDYSGFTQSQLLPVEILDFNVRRVTSTVRLEWTTSLELNNRGWDIERSLNGENFESIGFMAGLGTSTQKEDYVFVDEQALTSRTFYRLKQIDFDGAIDYSPVLDVPEVDIEYGEIAIFPNPVQGQFTISHLGQIDGLIDIIVINSTGQVVQEYVISESMNPISQNFIWNQSLPAGVYQLIARSSAENNLLGKIIAK